MYKSVVRRVFPFHIYEVVLQSIQAKGPMFESHIFRRSGYMYEYQVVGHGQPVEGKKSVSRSSTKVGSQFLVGRISRVLKVKKVERFGGRASI